MCDIGRGKFGGKVKLELRRCFLNPFFEYFCWSFLVQLNLAQVRYIEGKLDEVWMWVGWGEVEAVSYAGVQQGRPGQTHQLHQGLPALNPP